MITTKNVDAGGGRKATKLSIVTTRKIDATIKPIPEEDRKKSNSRSITTHDIADVAAIAAKKERDDIQAERNEFQKKLDAHKKRMAKAREAKVK